MPRKGNVPKRDVLPDPKFGDKTIARLINKLTDDGKKSKAEGIIYGAFDVIEDKTKAEPMKTFKKALDNIKPILEVKSRRVGGATYQVPMEVPQARRTTLAIRWVLDSSKARSGKSFAEKLADELMDAFKNEGAAIRKREETHKMAEANRAFSHYRM